MVCPVAQYGLLSPRRVAHLVDQIVTPQWLSLVRQAAAELDKGTTELEQELTGAHFHNVAWRTSLTCISPPLRLAARTLRDRGDSAAARHRVPASNVPERQGRFHRSSRVHRLCCDPSHRPLPPSGRSHLLRRSRSSRCITKSALSLGVDWRSNSSGTRHGSRPYRPAHPLQPVFYLVHCDLARPLRH